MSTKPFVIVGAGQAGGWVAQTLRTEGHAGDIVLIGDEPHRPYERPPLSKAVLAGEADTETTCLHKPDAFDALRLDWRPDVQVTAIDAGGKTVRTSAGDTVAYEKLILCTGGRARRLAVPGGEHPRVHALRSMAAPSTATWCWRA